MKFTMPQLPYERHELAPVISAETIDFHYGKHLNAYITNLNNLLLGSPFEDQPLNSIIESAPEGGILNNAGQVLNHTLYFLQFRPNPAHKEPTGKLAEAINRDFGDFESFKKAMSTAAATLFGSGWAWLSMDKDGKLVITQEVNGQNPVRKGLKPLMTIDVWEHAYYLDYQNRRPDHIAQLWNIIDWKVIEERM